MTTIWHGEPIVAVLRREPPRVRSQWDLRLRRSEEATLGARDIHPRDRSLFAIL